VSARDPHQVLKRILRTEKGAAQTQTQNKYFFDVDLSANKHDIKRAVEEIYKVKVQGVNTQIVPGKPKTVRYAQGSTSERKKAIVTLVKGQTIDITT